MTETMIASRVVGGRHYEIDTDRTRLDLALIHDFLANCSHWARGLPRETMERAIEHSLVFGMYRDGAQIGFARLVTDQATFAYLADVFVMADARNAGLGQWLIDTILAHPPLQGLRRWLLVTRDAAGLYRRCGFTELRGGLTYLERFDPEAYRTHSDARAGAASTGG